MEEFTEWLENELKVRDWRLSDLAKKGGIDTGSVSRILTGSRRPGPDVCVAIARALNLPPETVFRRAGLLPAKPGEDETEAEVLHLYRQLPPDKQDLALQTLRLWAGS